MRKSDFIDYLTHDQSLKQEAIPNIEDIISRFPYFSTAHILKSKALKSIDSIELDSQIRLAAAYSGDRKQLQSLLFNLATEVKEEVDKNTLIKEEHITEDLSKEKKEEDAILEKQVLVEAINSSILQEIPDEFQDIEEISAIEEKKVASFNTNETHSFSSWLNHFSDQEEDFVKPKNEKLAAISKAAISIQKKAEFYSASKMAKLSVQEDDDLITETLANVYVGQENYPKAIAAFEKLQLKFPEKKIYFAARIKEVQLLAKS